MSNLFLYDESSAFIKKIWLAAFGLAMLALSSVSFVNSGIKFNFLLFPQFTVFAIIGFLHAYNVYELRNIIYKNTSPLDLIALFFVYSAWYNIVLLPLSGLALFEWTIVLLVFTSNFITQISGRKISNPFMGQSPVFLIILGIFLFLAKTYLFYFFEDNIYLQSFIGNSTARICVFIFCGLGLIFLLLQLKKNFSNTFPSKKDRLGLSKVTSLIMKFLKFIANIILSMFSLPVLLIIISIAGILILIGSFSFLTSIYKDIMNFIEPFLAKIATTGKNSIHYSTAYNLCQTVSMSAIMIYTAISEFNMKKNLQKNISNIIVKVSDENNCSDEEKKAIADKLKSEILSLPFEKKLAYTNLQKVKDEISFFSEN